MSRQLYGYNQYIKNNPFEQYQNIQNQNIFQPNYDKNNDKDTKIYQLESLIKDLKEKIQKLTNEKEELNSYLSLNKEQKNKIKTLKNEITKKDKEIKDLTYKNKKLQSNIKNLENQIEYVKKSQKDGIVEKLLDLKTENEKLNNQLKERENNYKISLLFGNEIKTFNYELNKQLKKERDDNLELKNKLEKLKIAREEKFENYKKNDYNEEYIGKQLENFYDIIINIKSIKALSNENEGWPIKWNNKNFQTIKKFLESNKNLLKVGIVGNGNIGKSFLLSRIFNEKIPSGYSVITEGLSIKINQEHCYALLDSAGLQTPLLNNNQNQNQNSEEEYKQYVDLYKDKTQTENFIQNLILYLSDMLLIVVGKITFNEQRLINKIKNELISFNNNSNNNSNNQNQRPKKQQIFIIHNLLNFQTISQVKEHIDNVLFKSASFKLKEELDININNKENEDKRYFYTEIYNDINIYHLIMARESTEAGNYFNNYTYNFLNKKFNDFPQRTPLSILEEVKNKFVEWSKDLLEESVKADNIIIKKDENEGKEIKYIYDRSIKNENANNEKIVNEIKPKACISDELGLSIYRSSGYDPSYICYTEDKKGKNNLVVKMELPGKIEINDSYANLDQNQIIITGNKINEMDENEKNNEKSNVKTKELKNTRKFGKFKLIIPYGNEVKLADEEPLPLDEKDEDNIVGIKTFKFQLAKRRVIRNKKNK